ncbi:unnamed protein product [Adineta steineri]|uniref:WD repeat-containing protein on Y chromosome n=1 Tax=Adineta steineri TaxID=433720 RepID=A0A815ANK4_9BILA|nr:unnamed protein product [Adineta steineri]
MIHHDDLLSPRSVKNLSNKPYKALQTLHNAQISVRLPNRLLIHAVDQYLKYLRNETIKNQTINNDLSNGIVNNKEKILMTPLSLTTETSLERTVEDMVTFEFVEKVRKSFMEADTDNTGYLDVSEFTAFMRQTYSDITDREAQIIFMKIDTNCDGEVDLSEYLTYILFEHQEREIMYDMSKPMPYPNNPKEFTLKNLSLDVYIDFQFFPGISRAGIILDQIDYTYGRYISITRNGIVSHWSLTLKLIRESKIQSIEQRKQTLPLWITCMCVLPDMNYFVIATTERDLIFYDINSHIYTGSIIINHFPASLSTITYRMNLKNSFQSAIFCGDSLGNLFIFQAKDQYKPMFHISDTIHHMKSESIRYYSFPRIINNEYLTISVIKFCNLHYDCIVQIKWINDLDLFVSCALTSNRSLYIGDLHKKTEKYAMAKKGFGVFDYCTAHRSIVTGGIDGIIRFWDPFVTERAAAILRGHNSSITHLVVDNREAHVISIDKGKNIIIWDVQTLKMIQRISHTILDLSGQDLTICYLNPIQQNLIIGNRKLLSLSHTNELYTPNERTSHFYPITQILYNPLFDVIISSDESSTVNIWNIVTGEKIMHILNAHVTQFDEYNEHAVEITAMCLDETKRRLITGAHDGSLALWNFNNGHNLYRINSNGIHAKEITALLHENERLFVAGWSRRIRVFHLGKSVVIRQASYDGDIILWTIETGMPFMKLNSFEDTKPKLISLSWLYKQTTKGAIQAIFPKYFSRRRIRKLQRRHLDNTERIRQSLLSHLRTNYETAVESSLKSHTNLESNQSTVSSDYHLDQLIFLHTREINPLTATLVTGGSMGWIWWWSIHVIGNLIAVFNGARKPQEHILAMYVDEKCNILFTSDTAGYVALWFIGDYACKQPDSKEKQMKLVEEKNRILTKFSSNLHTTTNEIQEIRNQAEHKLRDHLGTPSITINQDRATFLTNTVIYPHLLITYRAHLRPITSIVYANDREIVITSSIDCTIRLFTLTGRYIGFMGQSVSWGLLSSTIILKDLPKRIPEDIRRKGSATTLEVLRGDIGKRWKLLKHTIVAWTSLPIFQYFYHKKDVEIQQSSDIIHEQSNIHNEMNGLVINHSQKLDTEVKHEWIQRRERLYHRIGLDRVDFVSITKKPSIESLLKTQRDNFGIKMPVLGRFVRKYMQHRPKSDFEHIKIHGGKAIIYSLLPLASSPDNIPEIILNSDEIQNDTFSEYSDIKLKDKERLSSLKLDGNSIIRSSELFMKEDKLPRIKKRQNRQIC